MTWRHHWRGTSLKPSEKYFDDLGVPNILNKFCSPPSFILKDGGLLYTSREFKEFLQKYGVKHIVSSPHNPQSNGHSESSVKSMKHLIKKKKPSQDNPLTTRSFNRHYWNIGTVPKRMDFHQLKSYLALLYGHVCLLIGLIGLMMLNGPTSWMILKWKARPSKKIKRNIMIEEHETSTNTRRQGPS